MIPGTLAEDSLTQSSIQMCGISKRRTADRLNLCLTDRKNTGPWLPSRISNPTAKIAGISEERTKALKHRSNARPKICLAKIESRFALRSADIWRAAEPKPIAASSFPTSPGISSMWLRHSSSKRSLCASGSLLTARRIRCSTIQGVHALNSRVTCLPIALQMITTIAETKPLISSMRVPQWWTPLHEKLPAHCEHLKLLRDKVAAVDAPTYADRQPPIDSLTNGPAPTAAKLGIAFPTLT